MKFCAEILPMSRTRLTIKITCKMDRDTNFDAAEYVNRNFDDCDDGWGLDLRNLSEIIGSEEEMKKILPALIKEADKKKKMMMMGNVGRQPPELSETPENKENEKNVKK